MVLRKMSTGHAKLFDVVQRGIDGGGIAALCVGKWLLEICSRCSQTEKSPRRRAEGIFGLLGNYTARVTFPERRQRVQAYTLLGEPSTTALTRLMLGFQVRLERL